MVREVVVYHVEEEGESSRHKCFGCFNYLTLSLLVADVSVLSCDRRYLFPTKLCASPSDTGQLGFFQKKSHQIIHLRDLHNARLFDIKAFCKVRSKNLPALTVLSQESPRNRRRLSNMSSRALSETCQCLFCFFLCHVGFADTSTSRYPDLRAHEPPRLASLLDYPSNQYHADGCSAPCPGSNRGEDGSTRSTHFGQAVGH